MRRSAAKPGPRSRPSNASGPPAGDTARSPSSGQPPSSFSSDGSTPRHDTHYHPTRLPGVQCCSLPRGSSQVIPQPRRSTTPPSVAPQQGGTRPASRAARTPQRRPAGRAEPPGPPVRRGTPQRRPPQQGGTARASRRRCTNPRVPPPQQGPERPGLPWRRCTPASVAPPQQGGTARASRAARHTPSVSLRSKAEPPGPSRAALYTPEQAPPQQGRAVTPPEEHGAQGGARPPGAYGR